MPTRHPTGRRALAALAVAAALTATSGAAAGVAHAATDDTSVTLQAGEAVFAAPTFGDFGTHTLDGSSRTRTASVSDWSVNDARGSGAGWQVSFSATTPATADATPVVMTGAALTLTAPEAAPDDAANTSTAPTTSGGSLIGGGVVVASAGTNGGMGVWEFAQGASDLTLTVPPHAKAGAYTSTITTTLTPTL